MDDTGFQWGHFGIYAAAAVPLCFIIGIASATIGFTAWLIMVPLLLMAFNFDLYDAIFISLVIDFIDGIALSFLYAKQGKVCYRYGFVMAFLASLGALVMLFISGDYLSKHQNLVKGDMPFAEFGLSLFFVVKGVLDWKKKQKKKKEEKSAIINEQAILEAADLLPSSRKFDKNEKNTGWRPENNKVWIIVNILLGTSCIVCGGLTGLLGIGNGLSFVMILIILFRFELIEATGTGCFVMALLMSFLITAYLTGLVVTVNFLHVLPYICLACAFTLMGCVLGFFFATNISTVKLNFFISFLLFLLGCLALIQSLILNHKHHKGT